MKIDLIVLQVMEKVKKDYGITFRARSIDDKGKNFLERYVGYAITNVKKILMQNLKRNAPTAKTSTGKRVKKKYINYDPTVHIKKERIHNDTDETMDLEIVHATSSNQDASTITMEMSKDNIKSVLMNIVNTHFSNGGGSLDNAEDFIHMWNNEIGLEKAGTDTAVGQEDDIMPILQQATEITGLEKNQNEVETNKNKKTEETIDDFDQEEEEYEGHENCGKCELVFNNCSTHNKTSLTNEYGRGMVCIRDGCGKTLLQCLNEGAMNTRGAYICENCNKKECRKVICTVCYHNGHEGRVTRLRSRV